MRLLYYCPDRIGGIQRYTHRMACALAECGADVTVLATPGFRGQPNDAFQVEPTLADFEARNLPRPLRRSLFLVKLLRQVAKLEDTIVRGRFTRVMLSSYVEYGAPLWAWKLRSLAARGVVFGAVLHDPVRDYVVGPPWWHRWSIASGYSFLREVFVHDSLGPEQEPPRDHVRTTVIPHGVFEYPASTRCRCEIRERFGIPQQATVLLSFGGIRDGKNLDRVIRVLPAFPDCFLVVAGLELQGGNRGAGYYRDLAERMGVSDRCRWEIRYVPDAEVGGFFDACDLVLLTYSGKFRSASGVLNTAVHYRKPCLASAGSGNLKAVMERYGLGVLIEPDSDTELAAGLQRWMDAPPAPLWEDYETQNSWRSAAEAILGQMA